MMLCVVAAAGLSACATAPTQQLGESQGTVTAAEAVGAEASPHAAYHLELARQQIASARPLMDGGRGDKNAAARLLVRAETDALLALQMARTARMRGEAKAAWADVNSLQGGSMGSGQSTTTSSTSITKESTESSESMTDESSESMTDESSESMTDESSESMTDESTESMTEESAIDEPVDNGGE